MISKLSLRAQIMLVVVAAGTGMVASTVVSHRVLENVRVNGPVFNSLVADKDLIADILPPPLYAVEAWLTCQLAINQLDKQAVPQHVELMKRLHGELLTRAEHWSRELTDLRMRHSLQQEVVPAGRQFFEIALDRYFPALAAGDEATARKVLSEELAPLYAEHRAGVDKLVEMANVRYTEGVRSAEREVSSGLMLAGGLSAGFGAFVIGFGVLVGRALTRRMGLVLQRMEAIAQGGGDLVSRVNDVSGTDEVARLARAFNTFAQCIHNVVAGMSRNMSQVMGSCQTIAASGEELATTMSVQSREVGGIAETISSLSDSITSMSSGANSACVQSREAGQAAEEGRGVVERTVQEIGAIETAARAMDASVSSLRVRSEKIGAIIEVINDIAEQTNLLALNAAIEAARAGEHGRGFAVVADEVRKLADRTTKATAEISGVIEHIRTDTSEVASRTGESLGRVSSGVKQASSAGSSLSRIVTGSAAVSDIIAKIAREAEVQSKGAGEVREKTHVMARSIAESEQATSLIAMAARDLFEQAKASSEILGRFLLERRGDSEDHRRRSVRGVVTDLGDVLDLSMTGVRLAVSRRAQLVPGSALTLTMDCGGRSIRWPAKVVWCRDVGGQACAGFQFTGDNHDALRSFVNHVFSKQTGSPSGLAQSQAA